jgi:cell wall assembly regulator SMI1
MTALEYLINILTLQKSLNFKFSEILRPAADILSIKNVEKELNIELTDDLKELYSYADGTICRTERNSLLCLIPYYDLLPLNVAVQYHKITIDDENYFYNSDKDFKPSKKLFPFLEQDGGDCYWIDLNKGTENYCKIYWTTTLAQEPDYLFDSLNSMFETIYECYEKKIIFFDKENILSTKYEEWGIVAAKNNPNLDYWKSYNKPD